MQVQSLWAAAGAVLLGVVLVVLCYQVPARHPIDVGGYDAAYTQGFYDPQVAWPGRAAPPYLAGSDGSARWTAASSYLLLPQSGLPGAVTLRLRGWRESGPPPQVTLLLNGQQVLTQFTANNDWQTYNVPISGGRLKATDIFIEIRAETVPLPASGQPVGVLVDSAEYRVGPGLIEPYPAQLLYGGLAGLLVWLLARRPVAAASSFSTLPRFWPLLLGGTIALGFLLIYRLQPPLYPYPLRWWLPGANLLLAALVALRYGPALLLRYPALSWLAVPLIVGGWLTAVLLAAQNHVTLSVPGVEKDFRVFAIRAESWEGIWRADGFYNLGYPLLLWLTQPLTAGNPFLAGRFVAALSGVVLLLAGYWLARLLVPPAMASLALLFLAFNPLVVQYALYVGSDMPFAASSALALTLLVAALRQSAEHTRPRTTGWLLPLLAGLAAGGAFLVRHPGLVLLPWGLLACLLAGAGRRRALAGWFVAGFLVAALPQLAVNTFQTGQPLYNQQAKNVWLAVYGDIDWDRWGEVPDSISLSEVALSDPVRFFGNWWNNLRAFGGNGGEDTSEFGRAIQLRLLAWPANWLAVLGLVYLGGVALFGATLGRHFTGGRRIAAVLLLFGLFYVALVSIGFALLRFFLPLTPLYAVAATVLLWTVLQSLFSARRSDADTQIRATLLAGLLLLTLVWGSFGIGARYVLGNQPADEVAIIRLVQTTLGADDLLLAQVSERTPVTRYSAIAHRVAPWPPARDPAAALAAARAQGVDYLLWDDSAGPPPLADPPAARIGGAGSFGLYRNQ